MNFQDVRDAREKQWVDGIGVTVKSFGAEPNDRFGNFIQGVIGVDAANEEYGFKIATQYEETLLVSGEIGQTLPFRLKWFNSKAGAQMQGYCTKPKKLRAQPAAQPTPQPQTPQRAPQAPTQQMPPPRDYDKENRGKCRFGFYQAAIQSGMSPTSLVKDKAGLDAIEQLVEYSMNGPNTGDQFAKDYNLPTMEEEAAQDTQNQQPPF